MKSPKPPTIKSPKVIVHQGKGSKSELLPSRGALASVTKGDPYGRALNNYSKVVPSIADEVAVPSIPGFNE